MATREDGAATQGAGWSDVLQAVPEAWPIPREVAGVELPDSKLARDATDYVREIAVSNKFRNSTFFSGGRNEAFAANGATSAPTPINASTAEVRPGGKRRMAGS